MKWSRFTFLCFSHLCAIGVERSSILLVESPVPNVLILIEKWLNSEYWNKIAKIIKKVIVKFQFKKIPNAYITDMRPMASAIVSQYLPTCEGLSRSLANSPSTASITPFIISKKQPSIVFPCIINQEQKIEI